MDDVLEKIIVSSLNEDLSSLGDITSDSLVPKKHKSTFQLIVNEDAVLAGLEILKKTFLLLDKNIVIKSGFSDGGGIKAGEIVSKISGNTQSILKAERTALNFVSRLSGIATVTSQLVKLIQHTKAILLDTRKTTPNLRYFEKQAVLAGGGNNHRLNLSEMVLIKDNHIDITGSVTQAVAKAKEAYKQKFKIEIEVRDLKELKEAILSKPDIIMFDNWNLKNLKAALGLVPGEILTEASGQISIENIKDYAESGVNYISTSYMVKNARWIDFSLNALK